MNYSFDIDISKKYGVDEAIVIENFRFWIAKNKANGANIKAGKTWTYNSLQALCVLFPFWTEKQIRRVLDSLFHQGVIVKGQHSDSKSNRTTWYAFKHEDAMLGALPSAQTGESICPNGQMDMPKRADQICPNGHISITDIKHTDNKPDNKPDIKQPFQSDSFFTTWNEWVTYRKEIKKRLTNTMIKKQYELLSHHSESEAIEILRTSIRNGWQGLFPLRKQNERQRRMEGSAIGDHSF